MQQAAAENQDPNDAFDYFHQKPMMYLIISKKKHIFL
jgi:hypothetical protein